MFGFVMAANQCIKAERESAGNTRRAPDHQTRMRGLMTVQSKPRNPSKSNSITRERVMELLDYDPETGIFRWKVHRRPQSPPGTIAGWHSGKKAQRIELEGENYLAHRLAWFYVHGIWPEQIDHINGDRSDNRIANLRPANNSQNQANMAAKSNNSTGYRGISLRRGSYIVQLCKTENGKKRKITKRFKVLEDAKVFAFEQSKVLHKEFSIFNRPEVAR
jgi:HNH endonuclease